MLDTYANGEGELDRAEMHAQYKTFCESQSILPKDLANFGKIVRNLFPGAGYRRLGGRGQGSVSHYSGIVLRHGDPKRAIKSQRKPFARAAKREEADDPSPAGQEICFIIETPQPQAAGSRPRKRHGGSTSPLPEERRDEEEEGGDAELIPQRRHKRVQVMSRRPYHVNVEHRQLGLDLTTVVREYRNLYRNELWGLTPINPACMKTDLLKYILFDDEGKRERSSLSFSCLLLLCVASFLNGDWGYSRSFYNLAKEHLNLIDTRADYDVAAGLVSFAWWVTFYADTAEEGKRAQLGYIEHGLAICHHLQAFNDEIYRLLQSLKGSHTMQKTLEEIEAAKRYPAYHRNWKTFRNLKRPPSMEWAGSFEKASNMFQYVLSSVPIMREGEESEAKKERRRLLHVQLHDSHQLEKDLRNAMLTVNRPSTQTFNMLMTFNYALRTMTCTLLGSSRAVKAAVELVDFLLGVPAPMMLIGIHELAVNDYTLIRNAVDVLVGSGKRRPLQRLLHYIESARVDGGFYWLSYICTYIHTKLESSGARSASSSSSPTPSSLSPAPTTLHSASLSPVTPITAAPSFQLSALPPVHEDQFIISPSCGPNYAAEPHYLPLHHHDHSRHHQRHRDPLYYTSHQLTTDESGPLPIAACRPSSPPFGELYGVPVPMPMPLSMTSTFEAEPSFDTWAAHIVGSSPSSVHQHPTAPSSCLPLVPLFSSGLLGVPDPTSTDEHAGYYPLGPYQHHHAPPHAYEPLPDPARPYL